MNCIETENQDELHKKLKTKMNYIETDQDELHRNCAVHLGFQFLCSSSWFSVSYAVHLGFQFLCSSSWCAWDICYVWASRLLSHQCHHARSWYLLFSSLFKIRSTLPFHFRVSSMPRRSSTGNPWTRNTTDVRGLRSRSTTSPNFTRTKSLTSSRSDFKSIISFRVFQW